MAILTDYMENKIIDAVFRGQALGMPATQYVALFTVAPTDSGGGTEVTGGSYSRQGITSGLTTWKSTQNDNLVSTGTGGQTSNTAAITWTTATGNYSAAVVAVGAYDASSSGNLLWYQTLTTSKTISTGDTPSFAIGSMTITID